MDGQADGRTDGQQDDMEKDKIQHEKKEAGNRPDPGGATYTCGGSSKKLTPW